MVALLELADPVRDSVDLSCDERSADSPLVERVWYSRSEKPGHFISMAENHWELVISHYRGSTTVTIRGPETAASTAYCPPDAEFIGIQFRPGVFMPDFPANKVMNRRDAVLPAASKQRFWLKGSTWEFPNYENADGFIARLLRDGLLVYDPLINTVLKGQPVGMSQRTVQRRFLQATGLSPSTFYQIERARYATYLLKQGQAILDVVALTGYADQPHLTRSLKRLAGQTPAQIALPDRVDKLSFLFNSAPF